MAGPANHCALLPYPAGEAPVCSDRHAGVKSQDGLAKEKGTITSGFDHDHDQRYIDPICPRAASSHRQSCQAGHVLSCMEMTLQMGCAHVNRDKITDVASGPCAWHPVRIVGESVALSERKERHGEILFDGSMLTWE